MATDLGALLSADIPDPVGFFIECKVDFLHKIKGIANHYGSDRKNPDRRKLFQTLLRDVNNYKLVAHAVIGRIPSEVRNEFVLYWGALNSFYALGTTFPQSTCVQRTAHEVANAFLVFIHKAEDLRQA